MMTGGLKGILKGSPDGPLDQNQLRQVTIGMLKRSMINWKILFFRCIIKKRIDGWPPCSTASPSIPLFSILSGWTNNTYYKGLSALTCSQEKGLKKIQRKEKKMEKMATDMIYRKISLKSVAPLILTTFVIFLMFSCATVYHGFIMKGSIIEASDSDVYLCIGSKDGASVGQELDVYKILETRPQATFFRREHTGKVRITEIIDEHFAKAKVISGKAEKNDIVELVRPK